MGILTENLSIKKRDGQDRVFCHEEYAQESYDKYCDYFAGKRSFIPKDMQVGQICSAKIIDVEGSHILVEADSSQAIYLDLLREKRFLDKRMSHSNLTPGMMVDVRIESTIKGVYHGSMESAFQVKLKQDLLESIKKNDTAWLVTVKGINDGGFMVDLCGIECFMPGSLAAANKILDFKSMVGKEVMVMIENYLETSDMFVVSNKKYIHSILPDEVKKLDYNKEYTGTITGIMSYGMFVEWNNIFTGLMHESELSSIVDWRTMRPGNEVSFWIKEVKEGKEGKDIRIILTQKGPSTENKMLQELKDEFEGLVFPGAVIKDIRPFGVFVELRHGIVGMMPPKEFKKTNTKMKEGEIMDVLVKQVNIGQKRIQLKAAVVEEDIDENTISDLVNTMKKQHGHE